MLETDSNIQVNFSQPHTLSVDLDRFPPFEPLFAWRMGAALGGGIIVNILLLFLSYFYSWFQFASSRYWCSWGLMSLKATNKHA